MKVWFNLCSEFILRILFGLPVTCFRVCILSFFLRERSIGSSSPCQSCSGCEGISGGTQQMYAVKWVCLIKSYNCQLGKQVGGWTNPFETYARQKGNLPQFSGWTYKNVWNHHPENVCLYNLYSYKVTSSVISMDSASPQWNHEHHETLPPPLPPLPGILEASKW